jgi:2C-methyl-D-erythritol 2,4-cyclodiphosphate synthase
MNRKGVLGSGVLYTVYFIMMAVIALGIYGGLVGYFGPGYDYRKAESRNLLDEVRECVAAQKFNLANLDKSTFYEKCKISEKVIEDGEHMIYIKDIAGNEFNVGVSDFKTRCFLNVRGKNTDYPLCSTYGEKDSEYILVGSSQSSRRVLA